jgi:hypothetical protein
MLKQKQDNEEKFFRLFEQDNFIPTAEELEFGQKVMETRLDDVSELYCEYFDDVTDLETTRDCIAECLEIVHRMRNLYFDAKDRREEGFHSSIGRQLAAGAASWLLTLEKQIGEEPELQLDFPRNIFTSSDYRYVMQYIHKLYHQVEEQNEDSVILVTCDELVDIERILEKNEDENLKRRFVEYFKL